MLATAKYIIDNYSQGNLSPLKPYQVVSLLDILRFYAEGFLEISRRLAAIPQASHDILWLLETLKQMHLPMSTISAERMAEEMGKGEHIDNKRVLELSNELYGRLHDELSISFIFMVPPDKMKFLDHENPIWGRDVISKFPDLVADMVEAVICFGFGRSTACVFHLMRIMELGVQKLGDLLEVSSTDEKVWQAIIEKTRHNIERKYPNRKQTERIKYENILAHLETIKIAWRNPTMHPKNTYTEEEAEGIINAVKIFMGDLVKLV